MAKLLVYRGRNREAVYDLRHGAVVGRARSCALQLDDRLVSRRHVRFDRVSEGWKVVDLDTPNGVWLNEERVGEALLTPGDTVIVGQHVLIFQEGDLTEAEAMVVAARRRKLMGPGSESTERLPSIRAEHLLEKVRLRTKAHVVVLGGGDGQGTPLDSGRFVVGFGKGVDIRLPGRGPLFGRQVCELIRDARGSWYVQALSGRSPVQVNGEPVALRELEDGDSIVVRGCTVRFHTALLEQNERPPMEASRPGFPVPKLPGRLDPTAMEEP